jgi:hypothetical protein
MVDSANKPSTYVRSTSDQTAFWILWVLLLIPAIWLLMMVIGSGWHPVAALIGTNSDSWICA